MLIAALVLAALLGAAPVQPAVPSVPGEQVAVPAGSLQPFPVEQWSIYGADRRYGLDGAVPGEGVVTVVARERPGDDWSSAASMPLMQALKAGDRIGAVFWARADKPVTVPALLLARAEPYASFARAPLRLTPTWQRFVVAGTAPADLAAGTQVLSIQTGKAPADIALGPVRWLAGDPGPAAVDAAFAGYRPSGVTMDVSVPSAPGTVLAASLRLPRGRGDGPFPVVLLLGGGGPSTRGVYPLLAERLLAQGIATFEYDKRGLGRSTGEFVDAIPLMQADATAAVAYLRGRPGLDPARIGVLGLSQGGVVAMALGARDPALAAVVTLAAPVGERSEPFMAGLRARFVEGGHSPAVVERLCGAVRDWMEARSQGAPASDVAGLRSAVVEAFMATGANRDQAGGMVGVLDTPALLSMYQAGPAADLARISAPVLVLFAEKDEVLKTSSLSAAQGALQGHRAATVQVVGGVNHGFQLAGARDAPAVSAPEALDTITRWLATALRPR